MKQRVSILDSCLHMHQGDEWAFEQVKIHAAVVSLKLIEQSHLPDTTLINSVHQYLQLDLEGPKWYFRKTDMTKKKKRSDTVLFIPFPIHRKFHFSLKCNEVHLPTHFTTGIQNSVISLLYCSMFTVLSLRSKMSCEDLGS